MSNTCKICNSELALNGHFDRARLLSVGICASCDFWAEKWKARRNGDVVRIHNNHYTIGEPTAHEKGMAGTGIRVMFIDGRQVSTDNLWHQGEIPEQWRELLPDNAAFVALTH